MKIAGSFVYYGAGTAADTAIAGANAPRGAAGLTELVSKAQRPPFPGL